MNLPIGSIILWADGAIPDGWQICDGTNGTPNMIGRFARGASSIGEVGTTGGSTTHSHTNSNTGSGGGHTHTGISGTTGNSSTSRYYGGSNITAGGNHSHSISVSPSSVANHSHTIQSTELQSSMPPYKVLLFIMRIS